MGSARWMSGFGTWKTKESAHRKGYHYTTSRKVMRPRVASKDRKSPQFKNLDDPKDRHPLKHSEILRAMGGVGLHWTLCPPNASAEPPLLLAAQKVVAWPHPHPAAAQPPPRSSALRLRVNTTRAVPRDVSGRHRRPALPAAAGKVTQGPLASLSDTAGPP
jgi:hypothetical protein